MSEYCYNHVVVRGSDEDLRAFRELVGGSENVFDFERVLPTPPEIMSVGFDTEIDGKVERLVREPVPNSEELISKYGADHPRSWSRQHWGTQSTAWGADLVAEDSDPLTEESGFLKYTFDTANCPPWGIFGALRARFPEVELKWFYDEPSASLAGYVTDDDSLAFAKDYDLRVSDSRRYRDQLAATIHQFYEENPELRPWENPGNVGAAPLPPPG